MRFFLSLTCAFQNCPNINIQVTDEGRERKPCMGAFYGLTGSDPHHMLSEFIGSYSVTWPYLSAWQAAKCNIALSSGKEEKSLVTDWHSQPQACNGKSEIEQIRRWRAEQLSTLQELMHLSSEEHYLVKMLPDLSFFRTRQKPGFLRCNSQCKM